jgi:hypothetical protein
MKYTMISVAAIVIAVFGYQYFTDVQPEVCVTTMSIPDYLACLEPKLDEDINGDGIVER